jgi:C1A family cysteine protease
MRYGSPWEANILTIHTRRDRLRVVSALLVVCFATLALSTRAALGSPPSEPPPPTEITLGAEDDGRRVQLQEGEVLVISLEANPSTGYDWAVDRGPLAAQEQVLLVQTAEEFQVREAGPSPGAGASEELPLLGAPETQVLRFQAAQAGETTLRLVYSRPWEQDLPPLHEFSLDVEAVGPFTGPAPAAMSTGVLPSGLPAIDLGDVGGLGLPSSFNWCDLGACTPVRNQGGCGSCWAFSTVGVLESNILYQDGLSRNLSEQYLLSCNTNGWDCDGGWFAHDYHEWEFPPGEPEAGAVNETDFPYVGYQSLCNPPHLHHETIDDWYFVGGSGSIPPVADIKQAILDYGPVSVAICTGSAFQDYGGGVFMTNECTNPNHAVVLVGWDDSLGTSGAWRLRNSWGPFWGESGYMWIGYGVSSVGYAANYVVYEPACFDLETSVGPAGSGTVVADPLPNCPDGGYEPDTVVELTAEASPGWHFSSWAGDALGDTNPTTITVDADKSVSAFFICDGCTPRQEVPLTMKNFDSQPAGWISILEEDFEGSFPASWTVVDYQSGYGDYRWGQRDCRRYHGGYAGWAVGAGADGSALSCGANYPNNADSWMVYGPFSLAGATDADLRFELWLNSEGGADKIFWGAKTDGDTYYGWVYSGYSGGWASAFLDLTDVYILGDLLGEPEVWIAVVFRSDPSVSYPEGAYVDDIVLRQYVPAVGQSLPLEDRSATSEDGQRLSGQPATMSIQR